MKRRGMATNDIPLSPVNGQFPEFLQKTNSTSPVEVKTSRLHYNSKNCEMVEIDESLYSRQLYVLGHESMKRMSSTSVLISGIGGLGAEIAKNVILSGVRRVVLHDTSTVSWSDLSSQFYLDEADIGQNRAEACFKKFAELNSYVQVECSTKDLMKQEELLQFQVVVLCGYLMEDDILPVADFCHIFGIKFILASSRGLFGQLFCDFGEAFTINDPDGEEPMSSVIEAITFDEENGIVTLSDNGDRGFSAGDSVIFRDVRGCPGLTACGPVKIKSMISPFVFSIGDTTKYGGRYEGGGTACQAKKHENLSFKSLREALLEPDYVISDFSKINREKSLHLAFNCLGKFCRKFCNGKLPEPRNSVFSKKFVEFCKTFAGNNDLIEENILEEFCSQACGEICPINAVIGGIAAQEVIKSVSGKFTPIHQFFYFDAVECLSSLETPSEAECQPQKTRYDAELAVFGRKFLEKLSCQRLFLVGAGAIGCEMLKNWAMMGIGNVTVTDMDLIERSNLNRQFLFRNCDIEKSKSEVAAAACSKMNPSMAITAHRNRVDRDSENVYNDAFFQAVDVVVNALDNVEARKYVDSRCVRFRRPLLESGTLGTKANIQVVLPDLTESYSSSSDPPERSYPICTIKNFPFAIEHTLQWARETFDACFKSAMFQAVKFVEDDEFVDKLCKNNDPAHVRRILVMIKRLLFDDRPETFEDCVKWARLFWQDSFFNQIKQMLFNFPPDAVTSEGLKFWSGSKRLPRLVPFDIKNNLHVDFVVAGANLRAKMFGIAQNGDRNEIISMLSAIVVPEFTPRTNVKVKDLTEESDESSGSSDDDEDGNAVSLDDLIATLPARELFANCDFQPLDFEKDDDSNFHMDFITAASNLRAEIYEIPTANKHKSKLIAGRIIPAIATTTSVVVGLVCLELIKIIQGHKDLSQFKNGFINLALPFFAFSTPLGPPAFEFAKKTWTIWDRVVIEGEPSIGELIDKIKADYGVVVTMMSSGFMILYSDLVDEAKRSRRKAMTVPAVIEEISGKALPTWQKSVILDICYDDDNETDEAGESEAPSIYYKLKK